MALQASAPTPAAFSRLCDLAAAARLSEQPEFQGWTAQTGRVRLASDAIAAVGSVLFGLGTLQHKTQHKTQHILWCDGVWEHVAHPML